MRKKVFVACAVGVVIMLSAALTLAGEGVKKTSIDGLPAAVKAAIEKQTQGASDLEVKVVYMVKFTVNGKESRLRIAEDGTILPGEAKKGKEEKEKDGEEEGKSLSINDLPKEIKDAMTVKAAGAKIDEIEKEDEDGKVVYSADIVIGGKTMEVKFDATGKVISEQPAQDGEHEDADDNENEQEGNGEEKEAQSLNINTLPQAIKDAMTAKAAGAKIDEIQKEDEDGKVVYSADIVIGGKTMEVKFDATGKVISEQAAQDGQHEDADDQQEQEGEHED